MTRIRDWFITMKSKRSGLISRSESVSFDAFTNDPLPEGPKVKESSLIRKCVNRPDEAKAESYQRFTDGNTTSSWPRPSFVSVILLLLLMLVFLILPIVYLMHCFDLIHSRWHHDISSMHSLNELHYTPGSRVHELLNELNYDAEGPTRKSDDSKQTRRLPPPPRARMPQCSNFRDVDRFDCFPESGASQTACESRGCCWSPPAAAASHRVFLNVPYCFYPHGFTGYRYLNVTSTAYGLEAYLNRTFRSPYPDDVQLLRMVVKYEEDNRLHIKIVDAEHSRYESPYPEVPLIDRAATEAAYTFVIDQQRTGFKVLRKIDNTTIFDAMNIGGFIYSNQFLQLSAKLPSKYIYGLAEHTTHLLQNTNWNRITLFNADQMPMENRNLYGSHPMYLNLEPSGKAHGMFLLNSNAMDIILQDSPAITFRTIGGVLDMYFLLGPTPADVVRQYTSTVGKPALPPLWGLGFHLCRFGYRTLNRTKYIMQRNLDAGIPLDVQWNDLDYMSHSNDFTYNKTTFAGLPEFVKNLHKRGMHFIPIIDPGISGSERPGSYFPYDKGIEMNVFVMNASSKPFIGKVWNDGTTVWPDFTNPKTIDYWTLMFHTMHDMFAFDGAWIDMNEPSNFLSGSTSGCPPGPLEKPPYVPGVNGGQLNYKTLCMSAIQYAGKHYDVHNLFGISEAVMTNFALAEVRGKRPFIISRSTFLGHGHYAGHWTGDVASSWEELKLSIPQILTFSILGIPLVGADICGFNGNTTAALCQRWMQLGAFYPFSRNHNTDDAFDQDPAAFGQDVATSSRDALLIRYSLLPYLYTLFWKAHVDGDTVARPLFFEFINDSKTYGIDDQFLWGSGLMICPVVEEGKTTRSVYFPKGRWFDLHTYMEQSYGRKNIKAPLNIIPLYIRGGSILPMQKPEQNTYLQRNNSIELVAAMDNSGEGTGRLYWDDGDSLNSVEEMHYTLLEFAMHPGVLTASVLWPGEQNLPPPLSRLTVLGIKKSVVSVNVNGQPTHFTYNADAHYLLVDKLQQPLTETVTITWK